MKRYVLTNGQVIRAIEKDFPGMAGEPMTILIIEDDATGNELLHREVREFLTEKDKIEIDEWSIGLSESNHQSALSWCE